MELQTVARNLSLLDHCSSTITQELFTSTATISGLSKRAATLNHQEKMSETKPGELNDKPDSKKNGSSMESSDSSFKDIKSLWSNRDSSSSGGHSPFVSRAGLGAGRRFSSVTGNPQEDTQNPKELARRASVGAIPNARETISSSVHRSRSHNNAMEGSEHSTNSILQSQSFETPVAQRKTSEGKWSASASAQLPAPSLTPTPGISPMKRMRQRNSLSDRIQKFDNQNTPRSLPRGKVGPLQFPEKPETPEYDGSFSKFEDDEAPVSTPEGASSKENQDEGKRRASLMDRISIFDNNSRSPSNMPVARPGLVTPRQAKQKLAKSQGNGGEDMVLKLDGSFNVSFKIEEAGEESMHDLSEDNEEENTREEATRDEVEKNAFPLKSPATPSKVARSPAKNSISPLPSFVSPEVTRVSFSPSARDDALTTPTVNGNFLSPPLEGGEKGNEKGNESGFGSLKSPLGLSTGRKGIVSPRLLKERMTENSPDEFPDLRMLSPKHLRKQASYDTAEMDYEGDMPLRDDDDQSLRTTENRRGRRGSVGSMVGKFQQPDDDERPKEIRSKFVRSGSIGKLLDKLNEKFHEEKPVMRKRETFSTPGIDTIVKQLTEKKDDIPKERAPKEQFNRQGSVGTLIKKMNEKAKQKAEEKKKKMEANLLAA